MMGVKRKRIVHIKKKTALHGKQEAREVQEPDSL
jgi:hypothetical protein